MQYHGRRLEPFAYGKFVIVGGVLTGSCYVNDDANYLRGRAQSAE